MKKKIFNLTKNFAHHKEKKRNFQQNKKKISKWFFQRVEIKEKFYLIILASYPGDLDFFHRKIRFLFVSHPNFFLNFLWKNIMQIDKKGEENWAKECAFAWKHVIFREILFFFSFVFLSFFHRCEYFIVSIFI